ncbi:hypothetical protein WA158_006467 [Blastocystis sp. Blastoise]
MSLINRYAFPILRAEDIAYCLNQLKIEINEQDLAEPNAQKIQEIYVNILEFFWDMTLDDVNKPNVECLQKSIPDSSLHSLYNESIPKLNLFLKVSEFLNICGIRTFSITDLIHPDTQHLIVYFSAIINLIRFRDEKIQKYDPLTNEIEELEKRKHEVEATNESLEKELAVLSESQEEHNKEKHELETQFSTYKTQISEHVRLQNVYIKEIQEMKEQLICLNNKTKQYNTQKEEIRAYIMKLNQYGEPETLQKQKQMYRDMVEDGKRALSEMERNAINYQAQIDVLDREFQKVQIIFDYLNQLNNEYKNHTEKYKKIGVEDKEMAILTKQISDQEVELHKIELDLKREIDYSQAQYEADENNLKLISDKRDSVQHDIDNLLNGMNKEKDDNSVLQKQIETVRMNISVQNSLSKSISQQNSDVYNRLRVLLSGYQDVLKELETESFIR